MKLVVFDDYKIGVLDDAGIHEVSGAVPFWRSGDMQAMNRLIAGWSTLRPAIEAAAENAPAVAMSAVYLRPPVPAPTHLFAAPANFSAHLAEMGAQGFHDMPGAPKSKPANSADMLGFFLKATGSISGPTDPIALPMKNLGDRRFDYEGEIAFVIGKEARGVSPEEAIDYIFGYTIVVDMTLRTTDTNQEERVQRKSFASFSPMGPCITTADEIDWRQTNVILRLNGEEKQHAKAADMTVDIPNMLSRASHVLPLQPGDVYTTGSPPGVGRVTVGDTIEVESPGIGTMTLAVTERDW